MYSSFSVRLYVYIDALSKDFRTLFLLYYKKSSSGAASTGLAVKRPFNPGHHLCPEHTAVNEIDQIPVYRETQRASGREVLDRYTEHLESKVWSVLEKW